MRAGRLLRDKALDDRLGRGTVSRPIVDVWIELWDDAVATNSNEAKKIIEVEIERLAVTDSANTAKAQAWVDERRSKSATTVERVETMIRDCLVHLAHGEPSPQEIATFLVEDDVARGKSELTFTEYEAEAKRQLGVTT